MSYIRRLEINTSDSGFDSGSEAFGPVLAGDGFAKIVGNAVTKEIAGSATKKAAPLMLAFHIGEVWRLLLQ